MAVSSWLPSDNVTVTGLWTFTSGPTMTSGASSTGATLTNPFITGPTLSGTVTGTYTLAGTPSITGAAMAGATTIASGATITTPTEKWTTSAVTATGTTGSTAAALPGVYPALIATTGVSGAGVNLPTGAAVAGAFYVIVNGMTGVLNIYSTGAVINGTTGTTAFALSATGNKTALFMCIGAGAWTAVMNT